MFLKNKNIIFKIRRSKVTDYAALSDTKVHLKSHLLSSSFYLHWTSDHFSPRAVRLLKFCHHQYETSFETFTCKNDTKRYGEVGMRV